MSDFEELVGRFIGMSIDAQCDGRIKAWRIGTCPSGHWHFEHYIGHSIVEGSADNVLDAVYAFNEALQKYIAENQQEMN